MNQFYRDQRKQQEIIARPVWEFLLKRYCPNVVDVSFDVSEDLDKARGIDLLCRFNNGMVIYGQTKILSYNYSHFDSVTVEYMNNPRIDEEGDWFNLGCQIYCCGYCSKELDKLIDEVSYKLRMYRHFVMEDVGFDAGDIVEVSKGCGIDDLIEQGGALINWAILDWYEVVEMTQKGQLEWYHNKNKVSGLADFKYILIEDLPKECIIASQKENIIASKNEAQNSIGNRSPDLARRDSEVWRCP